MEYRRKDEFVGLSGAEQLRQCVDAINTMRESFLDRLNAAQILNLWRAWHLADVDYYYPDDGWEERQVKEAAEKGLVPEWDENGKPIYPPLDRRKRVPMADGV